MKSKHKLDTFFKQNGTYLSLYLISGLLVLTIILMISNILDLRKSSESKSDIKNIISELETIWSKIDQSDIGLRGYYIIHEDEMSLPHSMAKETYEEPFESLSYYFKIYDLDITGLKNFQDKVERYINKNDELIWKMKKGQFDEFKKTIMEKPRSDLRLDYDHFVASTHEKLNKLLRKYDGKFNSIVYKIITLQVLLAILVLPLLVLVLIRLKKSSSKQLSLFEEINFYSKKYIFNDNERTNVRDEKEIITQLTQNLQKASDFVNEISQGNYDIEWDGMKEELHEYNKENIAGELVNMREQMKRMKEESSMRMWSTEGLTKFGEIVRSDQKDLKSLSKLITKSLVKYINAVQGGMFFLNEEDKYSPYLERIACYAYDKDKFIEKIVEPGDGLIWQTYREQKTVYMDDVPEGYMEITSGLGGASPRYLLIVPLMMNDVITGIMELASFHPFKPHEIEFVEKVGEIIASTINSIKINENTKVILKKSQEQTEKMHASEGELQQSIEELQATQEEMKRKETETADALKAGQEQISRYKAEISRLKEEISELKKEE